MAPALSATTLLLLAAVGCGLLTFDHTVPPPRKVAENDVREAVYRYQIEHDNWKDIEVFFLAAEEGADPSEDILSRFAGNAKPVKPVSACSKGSKPRVVDSSTGKPGLIFRVDTVRWINRGKVEVMGGYYGGALMATGNRYIVRCKMGKWTVVNVKQIWIS